MKAKTLRCRSTQCAKRKRCVTWLLNRTKYSVVLQLANRTGCKHYREADTTTSLVFRTTATES